MQNDTERLPTARLIAALAADAAPVRRLRPPLVRAGLFLATVAAVAVPAVLAFADLGAVMARWRDPMVALEVASALLAGVAGIVAAFHLALPDRARAWAFLPAPFLAVWIAASGAGCYAAWVKTGNTGLEFGEGAVCLGFLLGVGLPLGVGLLWMLRQARPLAPVPVAITGGFAAAALAALLLQFFHPFAVTVVDLGMHAAAVAIIVAASAATMRLNPPRPAIPT